MIEAQKEEEEKKNLNVPQRPDTSNKKICETQMLI